MLQSHKNHGFFLVGDPTKLHIGFYRKGKTQYIIYKYMYLCIIFIYIRCSITYIYIHILLHICIYILSTPMCIYSVPVHSVEG